ncbi:hypothetical protein [Caudoviricetes sp.]|nr:hypothetical protein [Caudoviricetes sp.]
MAAVSAVQLVNTSKIDQLSKRQLIQLNKQLIDALQALCAKLDADSGVGDTDYAATLATYVID